MTTGPGLPSNPAPKESESSLLNPKGKEKLGQRTQKNIGFSLAAQVALLLIRLASTAVLARFLTPTEYGLVGMVTIVTGFLDMFRDAGLTVATIQRRDLSSADLNSLFWINCGLGAVVATAIALLGPLLSWFYDQPKLVEITGALAIVSAVGSVGLQHKALLRRTLAFGKIAIVDISSGLVGSLAAIAMANYGGSYWSIVMLYGASAITSTVLSFVFSGWRPCRPAIGKNSREFINFGAKLTGASFFSSIAARADNLLIGHFNGATALGLYDRAYQLMMAPLRQFDGAVGGAIFPALCRMQDDPERLTAAVKKAQGVAFALSIPATSTLIVYADVIIGALLGSKWQGAVPIFSTLAGVTIFMSICRPVGWVLRAKGMGGRVLRLEIVGSCLAVLAFAIGVKWGPLGVARALLIQNGLWSIVLIYQLALLLKLGLKDVSILLLRPAALSGGLVAMGFFWKSQLGPSAPLFWQVISMLALAGLGTFIAFAMQPSLLKTVRDFAPSFLQRRK